MSAPLQIQLWGLTLGLWNYDHYRFACLRTNGYELKIVVNPFDEHGPCVTVTVDDVRIGSSHHVDIDSAVAAAEAQMAKWCPRVREFIAETAIEVYGPKEEES